MTFFMVLVFRLFIGVYKAVLLESRYCLDLVTGFVIFIRRRKPVPLSQVVHCLTCRIMGRDIVLLWH